MLKTYMKTASLMAIGMRGVAIINNQGNYLLYINNIKFIYLNIMIYISYY
jgi:hypothetical protein